MEQLSHLSKWASAIVAGALFLAAPARASDAEVLAHGGKWIANFDEGACELFAPFGYGESQVSLRISKFAPGDAFVLSVYGKRFDAIRSGANVKVEFGPGGAEREADTLRADVKENPVLMLGQSDLLGRTYVRDEIPPAISQAQEEAISWVDLTVPKSGKIRLDLKSMGKPMKVMRTCLQNMVRNWGYDPDVQATLSRKVEAKGNPATWATTNDYPKEMLRQGGQGIVRFRLDIDEIGAVTGCRVQQRTNPDDFAALTCRLMTKRAKFSPALDANGQTVKSFYVNTVRWLLPSG